MVLFSLNDAQFTPKIAMTTVADDKAPILIHMDYMLHEFTCYLFFSKEMLR